MADLRPKLLPGQTSLFRNHNGRVVNGICRIVETKWIEDGSHYHVYGMRGDGWERLRWVGDNDIITPTKAKD